MRASAFDTNAHRFQIRFPSLALPDGPMAFPCDAQGNVDMACMSEAVRCNYLFARIMVRRQCARPEIVAEPCGCASALEQESSTC